MNLKFRTILCYDDLPASEALMLNKFCFPTYAFFNPIPLLVTSVAFDLKCGRTTPAPPLWDLDTLCTVSTTTELVSCGPRSAKSSPVKTIKHLLIVLITIGVGNISLVLSLIQCTEKKILRWLCCNFKENLLNVFHFYVVVN